MKVEFLIDISDSGKFAGIETHQLVRLFDFDAQQAGKFSPAIQQTIIEKDEPLYLSDINFIKSINCNLTLRIADANLGIITNNNRDFTCDLTIRAYENMIYLLAPFSKEKNDSFQWLYDIDTPIDFLFSKKGTW